MAGRFELASYDFQETGRTRYAFKDADPNRLAEAVGGYFAQRGYRLEEGTPVGGVYGCGSPAMRFLFGAFAKRYRFRVTISGGSGSAMMDLDKAMTGAMGGAWGYRKMKKEYETVATELKAI
jgi:hypothetical protein